MAGGKGSLEGGGGAKEHLRFSSPTELGELGSIMASLIASNRAAVSTVVFLRCRRKLASPSATACASSGVSSSGCASLAGSGPETAARPAGAGCCPGCHIRPSRLCPLMALWTKDPDASSRLSMKLRRACEGTWCLGAAVARVYVSVRRERERMGM